MDWSTYDDVDIDPERVSGTPCLKGTRVPANAIVDNYDGFLEEDLDETESALMVHTCFPSVSVPRIHAIVAYRNRHEYELQT